MNIKILVCYHKKDFLLKNDVLVPIHCGRAVAKQKHKDGLTSDADYKWLIDNMIGDDTGDNISELNREVNEASAIYWAWKNYNKLGNPDYIGLCHYRRLFNFSGTKVFHDKKHIMSKSGQNKRTIEKCLKECDFIARVPVYYNDVLLQHMASLQDIIKLSENNYPELYEAMNQMNQDKKYYCTNMFILSRKDFFEYCETIFPIMFDFLKIENRGELFVSNIQKKLDKQTLANFDGGRFWVPRLTAFLVEYLTSFYLIHMMKTKKHKEIDIINTEECVKQKFLWKQVFSVDRKILDGKRYRVLNFFGNTIKIKRLNDD